MSTYRLDKLFAPRSVAVVGASPRNTSPGRAVLKNLQRGDFVGEIYLVNPHYDGIEGFGAFKSCDALPEAPDIVVIGVPPRDVPSVVGAAAAKVHDCRPGPRTGIACRHPACWGQFSCALRHTEEADVHAN